MWERQIIIIFIIYQCTKHTSINCNILTLKYENKPIPRGLVWPHNGLSLGYQCCKRQIITSKIEFNLFEGKYHCPVTYKVFNENSNIVAIRQSGNVYAQEVSEAIVCLCDIRIKWHCYQKVKNITLKKVLVRFRSEM